MIHMNMEVSSMILVDKDILKLRSTTPSLIDDAFKESSVTNIGYDVTTKAFYSDDRKEVNEVCLEPGESVFASSAEIIKVPKDYCVWVVLKNSRIRQGLSLDAPVYQPGHKTRIFFRLTNVSKDTIIVSEGEKYATIMFNQLSSIPNHPYEGAFKDEFSFAGLGSYQGKYSDQIKKLEKKADDLKHMEQSIYASVSIILSVFVGLFSLLMVNIPVVQNGLSVSLVLVFDFTLLGCISFLVALLRPLLSSKGKNLLYPFMTAVFLLIALVIFCVTHFCH